MREDDEEDDEKEDDEEESLADRFERVCEEHEDDGDDFEDIPEAERLHPNNILCGYLKVASLLKAGPESFQVCAEHDIVYLAPEDDLKPLTDEDIIYLSRCGIHCESEGLADFC